MFLISGTSTLAWHAPHGDALRVRAARTDGEIDMVWAGTGLSSYK
jgi:hypothetical protein